ncbi:hypothetical protein OHA02_14800 [Streptomyces phaeochromogenes]|nr:hypothetical protein [Streptomyces phaeochromogenes]
MLSPKQVAYWEARLAATATNKDRARALWDLTRTLAGNDDARWADLVRMLQAWTQAHTS